MKIRTCILGLLAAAGCSEPEEEPELPGLERPSCDMTWATYRVTSVELPANRDQVQPLGLDLDEKSYDGVDNAIGNLLAIVATQFPESWNAQGTFGTRAAAGGVHWLLEVGSCRDGSEVRVASVRGEDADGDGVMEVGLRGLPSVGRRGGEGSTVTTRRGVGSLPVGTLFAGSPTAATDGWQRGLGLTTAITFDDARVDGRLGLAIVADTEAALTPVMNFFNERLDGGASAFAGLLDEDEDGTITMQETRDGILQLIRPDVDLGPCDDVECYHPSYDDGSEDHSSLGLGVHAVRVAVEWRE